MSECHTSPEDAFLDAAREVILAVGWKRSTLTEVARRSGVSRMTIYRTWPDMQSMLADLLTREISDLDGLTAGPTVRATAETLGETVAQMVTVLRGNGLFRKIVEVDPELLLPYLLDRRGRSQDLVLEVLTSGILQGQHDGTVRSGNAELLARTVLLAAHGFALSAATMAGDPEISIARLDSGLQDLIERYLLP